MDREAVAVVAAVVVVAVGMVAAADAGTVWVSDQTGATAESCCQCCCYSVCTTFDVGKKVTIAATGPCNRVRIVADRGDRAAGGKDTGSTAATAVVNTRHRRTS